MGFKSNHRLMLVKILQNAPGEHSAILLTLNKFKTFGLSMFEWPLKTGFAVHLILYCIECLNIFAYE